MLWPLLVFIWREVFWKFRFRHRTQAHANRPHRFMVNGRFVKAPFIFAGINIILLFSINGISGTCDGIYVTMAGLRSNWIVLDDDSVSFEG